MIFVVYLLHVVGVSSFRWFPEKDAGSIPGNPVTYSLPKYNAKIEEVPHHALVYYARLYCSGSLVSSRTILTCAACFYKRGTETIYVKIGTENYLGSKTSAIRVIEIKIHEFYRRLTPVDNDIALLFLEKNVKFSNAVNKIPLMESDVSLRLGHAFYVSGYGGDNIPTRFKNRLLVTALILIEEDVCRAEFGNILSSSNYCARLHAPTQRLSDNGGGATIQDILVGILITGATSIDSTAAILTNVSYFHRWIVLNTYRFHEKYCNNTFYVESSESYEED